MCYQDGDCEPGDVDCVPLKSEYCLYLNIFAPLKTKANSNKAVIFYIHGGNFLGSTGAAPVMNGEILADKGNVIVVTPNYRMGAFGFLKIGDDITGNYGIKDQRLALEWVHANIGAFGGDNSRITIGGQSAGAYSAAIHLTSGNVDDLFSRVILESNTWNIPLKPLAVAEDQGRTFASLATCISGETVDTDCLKALTADQIVSLQYHPDVFEFSDGILIRSFMRWLPHIDGVEIMSGMLDGFENGALPDKEILMGTVKDEGMPYIYRTFSEEVDLLEMLFIVELFTDTDIIDSLSLLLLYPNWGFVDSRDALSDIATDYIFVCPGRVVARELADRGMNVYTYAFHQPLGIPGFFDGVGYCDGPDDVCHGVDVPYWFQSARVAPNQFSPAQIAFSDKLVNYWASFAKYGDPNQNLQGATYWPRFELSGWWWWQTREESIILEAGAIDTEKEYRNAQCNLWDSVGYF